MSSFLGLWIKELRKDQNCNRVRIPGTRTNLSVGPGAWISRQISLDTVYAMSNLLDKSVYATKPLSNSIASGNMWLFKCKLKVQQNFKFSFSDALVTFSLINSHMWLVTTVLESTDGRTFASLQNVLRDNVDLYPMIFKVEITEVNSRNDKKYCL